jgi:exocyst complex component 2
MALRYACLVSIQNHIADIYFTDAKIFYNLETWVATRKDPSSTRYLSQFEHFQRHMTTVAYKIAAGADLPASSSKASKQSPILQVFTSKITRAFLNAIYAFLDGLVLLASSDPPVSEKPLSNMGVISPAEGAVEMSLQELVDLNDAVGLINLIYFYATTNIWSRTSASFWSSQT